MNKAIVFIIMALLGTKAGSQGFMKSYHIEGTDSNNGVSIITDSIAYTLVSNPNSSFTGYVCMGVISTNTEGIKQWDDLLENSLSLFSPNANISKVYDTVYVFSGGLGYPGNPWQIFFSRLDMPESSFHTIEYGDIDIEEIGSNIVMHNDTLITGISYGDVNPYTYGHMRLLKLCPDLSLLESINISDVLGYNFNGIYYLLVSEEIDSMYLAILCKNYTNQRYLVIRKIDLQGNTIWEYPLNTYTATYTNTPTQIVKLSNGNIVTRWFDEDNSGLSSEGNPYLICLNDQGEFVWRYNFNDDVYKKFPVAITKAANGDIIGCGFVNNPNYNYSSGWLFRLSPNGELLWEREYVSYTPTVNFLVPQGIDEDANGNIIATGAIIDALPTGGYEGNALLLKVLPNGCFTPNCNGGAEDTLIVASTVVGIEEASPLPPPKEGGLVIFPNPTNDVLQILLPNQRDNAQIHITNLLGSTLKIVPLPPDYKQPYFSIATHDLPNGMYLVSYTVAGKQAITAKLIIVH